MNRIKILLAISLIVIVCSCNNSGVKTKISEPQDLSLTISKKYLNLPVSQKVDRAKMSFEVDGKDELEFVIRLAPDKPDYWVFCDVSSYNGKVLKIKYAGVPGGLSKI
jgi:fructan beta-fructosidase